jgi:calcium-translocating P-type ATPase
MIGIVQGFPVTRNGFRAILGRHVADLLFQGAAIVSLLLSGNPLGLALTAAESLSLLTEVVPRRAAWQRYEDRLADVHAAHAGAEIRVESGEKTPLRATVIEGTGTATGSAGLPEQVAPGDTVSSGCRLYGGPFVLQCLPHKAFVPESRPAPPRPGLYERYTRDVSWLSLAYAGLTALLTRSFGRAFSALLLVNPRTAVIGAESADLRASARVLRGNVTVVGTRPERQIRLPDLLLLDGPRVLTEGFEIQSVVALSAAHETEAIAACAAGVDAAAGSPWGSAFSTARSAAATDGSFNGKQAVARIGGVRYSLGPVTVGDAVPPALHRHYRGSVLLALRSERERDPIGLFAVRPRLAPGVPDLVAACKRLGVEIKVLAVRNAMAGQMVARRAGVEYLDDHDALRAIRARQSVGGTVAFVSDSAGAGPAFAACDLGIGLFAERTHHFPARADLLAPDLNAVAAVIEAGARRRAAARDAVALSIVSNGVGAVLGLRGAVGIERASQVTYLTALGAVAAGWLRLRGGERPHAFLARLADPRPERWGRRSIASVLEAFHTTTDGLSSAQAVARRQTQPRTVQQSAVLRTVLSQLYSPLSAILAAGAGISLVLGAPADVALIGAAIAVNVAVGAWQEYRAGQEAAALERLGTPTGTVLRDGEAVAVPAGEIVPGDVLLLAHGERVAADARLIDARGLEVDEAALTGESWPVAKDPLAGTDANRVILAGSDVTVGTGRAIVVAVGPKTRLGATAAALAIDETAQTPLGVRLGKLLGQVVPIIIGGGAIVAGAGLLRGQALMSQLAIGASIAIAAVPEGLPLLAGMSEAAVARRLGRRNVIVRRLTAVEALGRVDTACVDKTGTMTEGRLVLSLVTTLEREAMPNPDLPADARRVLLTAGLAAPHPDAMDAAAHATDIVVIDGARASGLADALRVAREAEAPFDPTQPYHASVVEGRMHVKGAVEAIVARCTRMRRGDGDQELDEAGRQQILAEAERLAGRGLRVLMVAEGPVSSMVDDPQGLVALGFLGISDPLRAGVPEAVRRCRAAGMRVIMLTGDHPATARAIAQQAGLLQPGWELLTGADIAELENGDLDERLEHVTVIARVTPLDKLRIVESLQRRGHTVAMTGDGVNDAPALRLADVGVAMGRGGTEVARQAADVVLADDDFSTLVEALVEGRSFWRNIRRALGLLLGGNLGELGLMVSASLMGLVSPLTTRQILAVNVVTDALPSLAVALQQPQHRNLAGLAREGTAALGTPLRNDVLRRGLATAAPALASFMTIVRTGGLAEARAVAFGSIVSTQLAQTLDAGWVEGSLSPAVFGAVAGSAGILVAALTVPALQGFLGLVVPGPLGWLLIGGGSVVAVVLGRMARLMPLGEGPEISTPALALPLPFPHTARLGAPRPITP